MSEAGPARAAQFLPFAALSGYADMVREAERHAGGDNGRAVRESPGEKDVVGTQRNMGEAGDMGPGATEDDRTVRDTTMPQRPQPHTLAGTNGVPLKNERTYLRVVSETSEEGETRPLEVGGPDGRHFKVVSSAPLRDLGRWERGTKVCAWEVTFQRRNRSETRRVIWWERGIWFARRTG